MLDGGHEDFFFDRLPGLSSGDAGVLAPVDFNPVLETC